MEQSRREKEKEERKKNILDAAESLFLSNGFRETRIEEIMAASQFSKRTIYQYFGSKEEILVAVTLRKAGEMLARYEEAAASEPKPLAKIRMVVKTFFHFFAREPAWYGLMTYPANLDSANDLNGNAVKLKSLKFTSKDYFERLLNEAKEGIDVPANLDARMGAQYLMVASMGILRVTLGIDPAYWEFAHIDRDAFLDFSIDRLIDSLAVPK